jgi:hypothetical protein
MGLSFHDEDSFVEATMSSICCTPDYPNPIPEMEGIGIGGQESSESKDDDMGI